MKALVISGFALDEDRGPAAAAALESALEGRGLDVETVDATAVDVRPCVGCGSCGLKTPGRCVVKDDMQGIYRRLVASDLLVLAGPVSFGAHCFPVKKIVDRLQPLMLPLYTKRNGELKFRPRYPNSPAWLGVGLLPADDPQYDAQEATYRLLLERHGVNLAVPAAAALAGEDAAAMAAALTPALDALLSGRATPASPASARDRAAAMPATAALPSAGGSAGPVLLIQGSPRKKANTRAMVAYLRTELEGLGSTVDVFHVPSKGATPDDFDELQLKLQACAAVVLVAPLYIDGLPPVTQRLLEQVHERRGELGAAAPRLYGIAHSGFPEPIQRLAELRTMELFAGAVGWPWQGGVGFGGTSPIDGRPLDEAGMFSKQLRRCLPQVAADIVAGGPFAVGTAALCDRPPFPIPLSVMVWVINRGARKTAREHGVELEGWPYAEVEAEAEARAGVVTPR